MRVKVKVRVRVYLGGYKTDGVGVCLAVADALQRFAALPHYYLYPDTMSSSKIRESQIFLIRSRIRFIWLHKWFVVIEHQVIRLPTS